MSAFAEPPRDRFCDLVMKGGITSGVVYPKAIALLARAYRFKNIGGSSAGAIAAALTAAAELNRRTSGSHAGFDLLEQLPEQLQARLPGTGRSKLLSLFQPQPPTRRLFSVLIRSLNNTGTGRRILAVLAALLLAYWPATLASGVAAVLTAAAGEGALAAVLMLAVALCILISSWVYRDLTRQVVGNGYGMCTGLTVENDREALTPWLHTLIQQAAGLAADAPPLTFGMLWKAPGFPPPWLEVAPGSIRSIDLQMFSTNLGHGRPYLFPLPMPEAGATRFPDRERLFFRREELARYLPIDVLDWMCEHARPYRHEPARGDHDPSEDVAVGLLELPGPEDFPVLLAARMSLGFPLLFAAVPLWAIDYEAPPGQRCFRRCWFSDGGISSNFPMHLFDGLVPVWPTFGISVEPKIAGREMVFLPRNYTQGYGERWDHFDDAPQPVSRFGGFLSAIVGTMQNWNDNALARMPGVRDRIARVRLEKTEGGMNLNMEVETMRRVAERGAAAARELIAAYASQTPDGPQPAGWDEQRWVRLGVLLKLIQQRAPGVVSALDPECRHATNYDVLIERAGDPTGPPPAGYERPLSAEERQALHEVVQALGKLAAVMSEPQHEIDFKPVPKPELRVRPPL